MGGDLPEITGTPTAVRFRPQQMGVKWLLAAAAVTILLWQVPWGGLILYPFTLLATWFHEMAHGLTAILMGGEFRQLLIFPNASGVAVYRGAFHGGSLARALVAAGGPMGPPLAGALFIFASRRFDTARLALLVLGGLMLASTLVWVRSLFGLVFVPMLGLIVIAIGVRASREVQGFAIQFLGVQACISTFHQVGYLFSSHAGPGLLSDSAQMAEVLILPYWFWGGLMTFLSLALLWLSLRSAYRQ